MYKMISRITKQAMAAILSFTMVVVFSMPAQAAPFEKADGTIFDDAYYYIHNPDVAASCGPVTDALYNHYKKTGKAEGRLPADPNGGWYIWDCLMDDQAATLFPKVDAILAQITNSSMSDRQKVDAVVNWMCDHISYDYDYVENNYRNGRDTFAESVIDDGLAVCDGYADVFEAFMFRLGIPCTYVSGYANGSHAWNQVNIDGTWYVIDTTWYDGTGNYYLTDANVGWPDHTPQTYAVMCVASGVGEFLSNIGQ